MSRILALMVIAAAALVAPPLPAHAAPPSCDGARATIVGTAGDDRLVGTPRRDVIVGLGGDDTVLARGGDDLVCGGEGADRLEGGPGDDRLLGGLDRVDASSGERCAHGDQLDGGAGDDLLVTGRDPRRARVGCGDLEQLRFRHGGGAVRVHLGLGEATGQGLDRFPVTQSLRVVGSDGDDVIVGSERHEEFDPRKGNDSVVAGDGRDLVNEGRAGNGNDSYFLGDGRDTVITRRGRDGINAGSDDDVVIALNPARTTIDAGHGADEISRYAAPDQERLSGGEGPDQLLVVLAGGPADPMDLDIPAGHLTVDGATVVVAGFETWVFSAERSLTVTGSDQPEIVNAWGRGNAEVTVTAWMGGGDDQVHSDEGDDRVDGGDGDDYADLGAGADVCEAVEAGPC